MQDGTIDPLLAGVALAHVLLGLVCLGLLTVRAPPLLGVHPAMKPLKFAFSTALFLGTMAALLPSLSVSDGARRGLALVLSVSMAAEMAIIGGQALRGRTSHFNFATPQDGLLTGVMMVGIVALLLAMVGVALLATARPLTAPPLLAAAWRSALWLFLFASLSGFAMGGRAGHTVGRAPEGRGLPVTNWSTTQGDLRVSHFFALHSLQIIPLAAMALAWLPLGSSARWVLLVLVVAGNAALAGSTFFQALASRPVWRT